MWFRPARHRMTNCVLQQFDEYSHNCVVDSYLSVHVSNIGSVAYTYSACTLRIMFTVNYLYKRYCLCVQWVRKKLNKGGGREQEE